MKFGVGFLLTFLVALHIQNVAALSCAPCDYDTVQCTALPDDDCFPAYPPCGCCPRCALQEGVPCDSSTVRCHPDFVCVNSTGSELKFVSRLDVDFKGTCQESQYDFDYEDDGGDDDGGEGDGNSGEGDDGGEDNSGEGDGYGGDDGGNDGGDDGGDDGGNDGGDDGGNDGGNDGGDDGGNDGGDDGSGDNGGGAGGSGDNGGDDKAGDGNVEIKKK